MLANKLHASLKLSVAHAQLWVDRHLGMIMNIKIAPLRRKVCSSDHDVHSVFRRHGCCNCFEAPELQNQAFLVTDRGLIANPQADPRVRTLVLDDIMMTSCQDRTTCPS